MYSLSKLTSELAIHSYRFQIRYRRFLLPCLLFALLWHSGTRAIATGVLADAFFQVSAFVAGTLALYYGLLNTIGQSRLSAFMQKYPIGELTLCSFMGTLPGCGGAIIVITQFTQGRVSFGAVVAVLTATMGDAAFLLLSQRPEEGVVLMLITMGVGVLSGWVVNLIHAPGFLRIDSSKDNYSACHSGNNRQDNTPRQRLASKMSTRFWELLLLPVLTIGVLAALQVDANHVFGLPAETLEFIGALLCFAVVVMWAMSSSGDSYEKITSEERSPKPRHWMLKVAQDTQFVTSWVVAAFLVFELTQYWFAIDLVSALSGLGPTVILLAILMGLLPGCGPQILVTSIYLQSAIPFSAQLANAISNDGDALFPAIAMAPKAALIATFYSALPAIVFGYGYYWLFE